MHISLTSDFQGDTGSPEAALRAIAAAGFSHVHWCHQWNTDFLYAEAKIRQIDAWLRELGLKLLDLHGSAGREKCWFSVREYERLAGVELVRNRIEMTARLGGASVVMHLPRLAADSATNAECQAVRRTIDELSPVILRTGVRLAVENMPEDDFRLIGQMLDEYGPDITGICYDCGHGNIGSRAGLDHLERRKDRLIALHLHDNDGTGDQHLVPFTGTVDFGRLARIIASSSYRGCVSMESNVNRVPEGAKASFVADCYVAGTKLASMVAHSRA